MEKKYFLFRIIGIYLTSLCIPITSYLWAAEKGFKHPTMFFVFLLLMIPSIILLYHIEHYFEEKKIQNKHAFSSEYYKRVFIVCMFIIISVCTNYYSQVFKNLILFIPSITCVLVYYLIQLFLPKLQLLKLPLIALAATFTIHFLVVDGLKKMDFIQWILPYFILCFQNIIIHQFVDKKIDAIMGINNSFITIMNDKKLFLFTSLFQFLLTLMLIYMVIQFHLSIGYIVGTLLYLIIHVTNRNRYLAVYHRLVLDVILIVPAV